MGYNRIAKILQIIAKLIAGNKTIFAIGLIIEIDSK